ncbi:MAG: hypothetical protein ABIJ18_05700 [archaeon]
MKNISKEDLINYILKTQKISRNELLEKLSGEKIPITIFTTDLFPLESIVFYLKKNHKTNEIARLLNKSPSAISLAYKKAKTKKFKIKETKIYIPLSEFNSKLSILEVAVYYLRRQDMKFAEIAKLLKRNIKTIWTIYSRAKKK